jgi:hypothetical protein
MNLQDDAIIAAASSAIDQHIETRDASMAGASEEWDTIKTRIVSQVDMLDISLWFPPGNAAAAERMKTAIKSNLLNAWSTDQID